TLIKNQLLTDIELIKEVIPEINDDLGLKKLNIKFNIDELTGFLNKIKPLTKILGIQVILPIELENIFKPKITLNLEESSNTNVEFFSIKDIINFDWKIAVGSKSYTKKQFKKLVNKSEDLITRNYDLNLLDENAVLKALKKLDDAPEKLSQNELLQGLLSGKLDDIDVNVDVSLDDLIDRIKNYKKVKIPDSLNATLRQYQANGYYWLVQNIQLGFGSILADDMGLGKTIQVLTTVLHLKENSYLKNGKVLVVVPTSLLYNWEKEIEKFTPSLKSFIYHGPNRIFPKGDYDILLTSYGVLRRDLDKFKKEDWFLHVIDEAQNIKNPNAKQTKAIKAIKSGHKIALTGTPVENRLLEYWSIFDFTNKNYLYSSKQFKRKYINPIEKNRDKEVLDNFKEITGPFILRRLKNDKKIINDLPDKNINDIYCNLTVEQAALYQKTLDVLLNEISYETGIGRKGLIFKLINSLKQICNHPAQFSKSKIIKAGDSGKMETLIEILKNIDDVGEKTLIFTQYVQMGKIMKKILEEKFHKEILFLHGSLSREQRNKMINDFQNNPDKKIFILSLKVGGIGLNLTSAQNVIHYDLWWNPAVENQATDRVYRIGQKENIMVYRLITSGTFEEQINEMLIKKEELFEIAIGSGEKFLTEMSNDELEDMFELR
ncbi:DEAD/DEAH box helicase, partial [Methanobrevibacter sp. OttesenSCG-928-I08]|nr:DEAD/DEAH box helicase [Methanobrevibacter sp. OttesenSCG-928-I08]